MCQVAVRLLCAVCLSRFSFFEDGTDTGFRNVGQLQFDAGEIPKRTFSIYVRVYTFSNVNSKESAVIIFSAESFSSV